MILTTLLILLTLFQEVPGSGKRTLGKLAGKEICKMETFNLKKGGDQSI